MLGESGFQLQQSAAEGYARHTAVFMLPLVEALLDVAAVAPGDAVLDLACGPGYAARSAAARVGPSGRVAGVDINAGMIAVARAGAATEPVIEWHVAGADDLPFADASFDAVVSQQGIQFFPDLHGALREMARVTRPGGSITATAWTALEETPALHSEYVALSELIPGDAASTFPAAFRMTDVGLAQAWASAGLHDVEVSRVAPDVALPAFREFVLPHISVTPWGKDVAAQSAAVQGRFIERVCELMSPYMQQDGSALATFSSWVVTGRV